MKIYGLITAMLFFLAASRATGLDKLPGRHLTDHSTTGARSDTIPRPEGKLIDLGPQIMQAANQGAAFMKDKQGRELLFTVNRGLPGRLIGYELKNNTLITNVPLPQASGAWSLAASTDGIMYIGGAPGHLYGYTPGDTMAVDLGVPLGTETYTWDVKPGENGEIFGSTYPGCRIFRYHPKDGFSDVGRGPLLENENYVRGFDLYPEKGKIYAGIGSHANLVELDIATGVKKQILPEKYRDQEFVYDVEIVRNMQGGDRLLVTVVNTDKTLIYNLKTSEWEREMSKITVRTALKSPDQNKIYYGDQSSLLLADLTDPSQTPENIARAGNILASRWVTDQDLYLFTGAAELIKYNTILKKPVRETFRIPKQPIIINIVRSDSDGKIWTSGYLSGGNAVYDPLTGKSSQYRGLAQAEGMTPHGPDIYFGIYPHGRIYVYKTTEAWDSSKGNPKMIAKIPNQSRFYAGVDMGDDNTLFFGSVPEYGRRGGSFIEYKSKTGELSTYDNLLPDLSIVSLTKSGGLVIGGTSVWGGLGAKPTKTEAPVFGWDVAAKKKVFEVVPVADAKSITALVSDKNGDVWGMADGILFLFNPGSRSVRHQQKVYDYPQKNTSVWHEARLLLHPDGNIYGTGGGKLFKVDPVTKKVTMLLDGASKLAMDKQGRLYFSRGTRLWQYTLAN